MRRRRDYAEGRHMHPDYNYADNRRQPSPQQHKPTSPNNRRNRERSKSLSPPVATRSNSKADKSASGNYSSKELQEEEQILGRNSKSGVRRQSRDNIRVPTSPSSPQKCRTLTSSIGAVISHESDGEYNPEKMLKKSIVASQVS